MKSIFRTITYPSSKVTVELAPIREIKTEIEDVPLVNGILKVFISYPESFVEEI